MKELNEYLVKTATKVSMAAHEAYQEVIDEESHKVFEDIQNNTPVRTGRLKASLKIEKIAGRNLYGYKIHYDGYNEKGVPFALIANALNKGASNQKATRHITRAVRKLKGIDARIEDRFLKKINKG